METNDQCTKAAVAAAEANLKQSANALELAQKKSRLLRKSYPRSRASLSPAASILAKMWLADAKSGSMFLIADLNKMQIWAQVNEADMGRIREGMDSDFHRRCLSRKVIKSKVTQIRLNAQKSQNVVTYTVVLSFDNSATKLLPYLTANVKFEIDSRRDVLRVPNAALRWRPQSEQLQNPSQRNEKAAIKAGSNTAQAEKLEDLDVIVLRGNM